MATAPTFFNAYVIPTDGTRPHLEDLSTIEEPNLELIYPDALKSDNRTKLEELEKKAAATHLLYDLPEGTQRGIREGVWKGRYQPDIRLLPDTRKYWGNEKWSKRAAIDLHGHHVFYSRQREGPLNKYANCQVSGEMFLLKLSDTTDGKGKRFYVDFNSNPDADEEEDLEEIFSDLSFEYYYGDSPLQTDILAYILPEDSNVPRMQYIDTIEQPSQLFTTRPTEILPSSEAEWDKLRAKDDGFYNVSCKDERTSRSQIVVRKLPDIQPKRPKQWDDRAWKKRIAVGDAKWHMFLTLTEGGNLQCNPNISDEFPPYGDVYILKVSGDVDSKERWVYEDVDSDGELSSGELENLIKHLTGILEDVVTA